MNQSNKILKDIILKDVDSETNIVYYRKDNNKKLDYISNNIPLIEEMGFKVESRFETSLEKSVKIEISWGGRLDD